jgi:hypothetical protein
MVNRYVPKQMMVASNTKLKQIIDKQVIEEAKESKKVRSSMYASDYGQCMRKIYYQFFPEEFPVPEELSPRTYRIFANGNDVHERLSKYLNREIEIEFSEEVNIPRDELDVHGRCDGICTLDNVATVTEFKSINAKDVRSAKTEHQGQIMFYMLMFMKRRKYLKEDFGFKEEDIIHSDALDGEISLSGLEFDELDKVDKWLLFSHGSLKGEIIYESKQNQELFSFPIAFDAEKARAVRLWFEQLNHYIKTKTIPPVHYDPAKYPCSWGFPATRCQYHSRCWSLSGEDLIKIGSRNVNN